MIEITALSTLVELFENKDNVIFSKICVKQTVYDRTGMPDLVIYDLR